MEPIRVAQVMGYMNGGGVEQVVMNYYRHVDRRRVQFDFLVSEGSGMVPCAEIESLGGRVFMVPSYSSLARYSHELEHLFRSERWPIVHSHVNALSVFSLRAAKRAGVPVRIAHSHSTAGRGECAKNIAKSVLKKFANVYPTYRMACSRYAGEWLFGKRSEFEVLYNAVDLSRFSFDADIRASARAELGLDDGCFALLHVGRFMTQKNHRFLVEVFAELVRRRPNSVLLLVGSGEDRGQIESLVGELGLAGQVLFLGQRDDVERLYMVADAFVLPSLYEGLGVVGIEAQASGLPCFLSDQITREVDVTGMVRFLPLVNSNVWADALSVVDTGARHDVRISDFELYDINRAAESLVARYLELEKEPRLG